MIRLRLAALFLSATAGLTAAADPPAAKPPADKKDPQAAFEPRSGPGAGQKFLAKFVGDWEVTKTFHPRAGDPVRAKGECRQAMIHGGRFLQSEFTFESAGGGKTTGLGLIGFEPDSGKFNSVWTDSRATRMSFRGSDDRFNGEEITLISKTLAEGGRETRRSRTVTRLEDDGKKIVHRQWTTGPDGKERVVMEMEMVKKAAPATPPGK